MKTSLRKRLTKLSGLFLGLAMGLGVAVGVTAGNKVSEVKGAEGDATTLDMTNKAYGTASYNGTLDYGDWKIVNGANNNKGWAYFKMGGKSATLTEANPCYIYYTKKVAVPIKQVKVSIASGSLSKSGMSVNSWGVYVYSDSGMTTQIDYVSGGTITGSAQNYTFTPSSGTKWNSNSYYKVSWNLKNTTTTNGIVCVDKIQLIEGAADEGGVPVEGVSLNKNAMALEVGQTETLTATVLPADATNKDVKWESTDTNVASVDSDGLVVAKNPGTATITVTTIDQGKTDACTVSVSARDARTYYLIESADDLATGDIVIFGSKDNGVVATDAGTNDYLHCSDATFNEADNSVSSNDAAEFTITKSGANYTFTSSEGTLGLTAVKKISFTSSTRTTTFTISINNGNASVTSTTSGYGTMKYNTGSPRFTTYASGQADIELYKYGTPKTLTSISVKTNPKLLYAKNETFDPSDLEITLKYDDESTKYVSYAGNESKFTIDTTTPLTANGSMTIGYGGLTTSVNYTVQSHQLSFGDSQPKVLEIGEKYAYTISSHTFGNTAASDTVNYSVDDEKDTSGNDTSGVITKAATTANFTANKEGTASIKAVCTHGGEATYTVTVVKMHANKIIPSTTNITLAKGLTSEAITVTFAKDEETVIPTNKNFTITSNDEEVATVSSNKVKAVAVGDTTLTVKATADESVVATIDVKVTIAVPQTFYAPASTTFEEGQVLNETLNATATTRLRVARTDQTKDTSLDVTMDGNTKAWISDTENGTYTELAMDSVLTSNVNRKYIKFSYTESDVTVYTAPKLLEVYYIHTVEAQKTKSLKVGDSYTFVKGTDYETNCTDLTWTVSKGGSYATVSDGVLTITSMPQDYTSYTIEVSVKSTSKPKIKDTFDITISYKDVTSVTISESEIEISINAGAYQLTAEVIGENCRKDIKWVSEDTDIVTVTQTGKVSVKDTVMYDCTTNVYAYVDENLNGSFDKDTEQRAVCKVNVKLGDIDADEIIFENDTFEAFHTEITEGQEIKLAPTIGPINATVKALHWTTSNTAVAKLANYSNAQTKTIQLTGASGTAVITAETTNESGKQVSATYTINILHDEMKTLNLNTTNVCNYFEVNTEFNYIGLTASINYDNNTALNPKDVTNSISVTAPDMTTTGEKDVVVSYVEDGETVTSSYKITVDNRSLQSIEWVTEPTKTTYYVGDTFSLDGLNIQANYNFAPMTETVTKSTVGFSSSIEDGYIIKDSDVEKLNGSTVTVSYGEKSLTYTINVKENFSNTITGKNYVPGSYSPTTTQIESLADIKEGIKVVLKNNTDSQFVTGYSDKDATITTAAADALIFTVIKSGDNFKLSCTYLNSTYYVQTETSNQFHLTTTSSNAASISFDSSGNLKLGSRFLCKNGSYYRQYNSIGTYHVFNLYSCAASSGTWGTTNTPYSDEGEALAFARKYLHLLTNDGTYYDANGDKLQNPGLCKPQVGHENSSFVTSLWSQMKTEFGTLSENSQRMLIFAKDNGETGTNSIEKFVSLYDYIVSRYETDEFIGRKVALTFVQKASPKHSISLFGENSLLGETSSTTWIITIIALAGIAATGGYFYVRKRKED